MTKVQDWVGRLSAACGPMLAALLLAALCGGPLPELATFAVLIVFGGGLAWLGGSSQRYRDLWMVTGPLIAFVASVAGLVFTAGWELAPTASAALWFGPALSLVACATWAMKPGQAWPAGTPALLAAVPVRVGAACAGAGLAALAVSLGGLQDTPWHAAVVAAVFGACAAVSCVLPLGSDIMQGRAADLRLARIRKLLEREEGMEWLSEDGELDFALPGAGPVSTRLPAHVEAPVHPWSDPDLEARAAGLQRDLLTAQDRIAEQSRVIVELKSVIAEQTARIDRLSAGYRRVREAATGNLSLLGGMRRDVEGALNDVGIISDSVGQIVGTSESTDLLIDESRQRLREALESMEYVRLSIEDSLDLVEAFAKRSRQIEDVLKDIADIA
ncbi:MAG: hypothetical protein FJZ00_12825, partial [Candidatus Sericytochromatia bacterium]|nr:hypothetical protein [Candidatus Tanganyikabacteria bacterium]